MGTREEDNFALMKTKIKKGNFLVAWQLGPLDPPRPPPHPSSSLGTYWLIYLSA